MAQMVVGRHGKALFAEIPGEGRVARAVLRHTVGYLHHAQNIPAHWRPLVDMDQGFPVAGWEEIF